MTYHALGKKIKRSTPNPPIACYGTTAVWPSSLTFWLLPALFVCVVLWLLVFVVVDESIGAIAKYRWHNADQSNYTCWGYKQNSHLILALDAVLTSFFCSSNAFCHFRFSVFTVAYRILIINVHSLVS